jgi:hypothetical protein
VSELAERAETFALRQERNAVYRLEDLIDLFVRAGFEQPECDVATIAGKRFARLVATVGKAVSV